MKSKLMIRKAIAFVVIFFIIISLKNICNAYTLNDLAYKYQSKSNNIIKNSLTYNLLNNNFKNSKSSTQNSDFKVESKDTADKSENYPNNDDKIKALEGYEDLYEKYFQEKTGESWEDYFYRNTGKSWAEHFEEKTGKKWNNGALENSSEGVLDEEAKKSAICDHHKLKLYDAYLWTLPGNARYDGFYISPVVGKINIENVEFSDKSNVQEYYMVQNRVLFVRINAWKTTVRVTVYDYIDGQWYKDTCTLIVRPTTGSGSSREHPNLSTYSLGNTSSNKYRIDLLNGKSKTFYITVKDGAIEGHLNNFSDVEMEYDNNYIDVEKTNDRAFKITAKKSGSSYLFITFYAKDPFGYNEGYYGVFATVEISDKHDNSNNNNSENDNDYNDDEEIKIPDSISLEEANPIIKVGDDFKFQVLCDGEEDYTENYSWTYYTSNNKDIGDFRDSHDPIFKAKKPGKVDITIEKDIIKGSYIVKTLKCHGTVTVIASDD